MMSSINLAPVGETIEVKWLIGNDEYTTALNEFGINTGSLVTVIARSVGSLILGINKKRIVISADLAEHIKI